MIEIEKARVSLFDLFPACQLTSILVEVLTMKLESKDGSERRTENRCIKNNIAIVNTMKSNYSGHCVQSKEGLRRKRKQAEIGRCQTLQQRG